jgi:hypothetical protein
LLRVGWVKPQVKVEGLTTLNLRLRVRAGGLSKGWQVARAEG